MLIHLNDLIIGNAMLQTHSCYYIQAMQDQDSEYENGSQSMRYESRPSQTIDSKIDYRELIRVALLNYKDVDDDDFIVLSQNNDLSFSLSQVQLQYNRHTLVPIGANFQAVIPAMMTEAAYKAKSADQMRAIRILKINDPEEGCKFFQQHIALVNELVGPNRTYEDVNLLHNAFKKLNSKVTFPDYLTKNQKHWDSYFKRQEKAALPKPAVKKKKKKGTIPV